MMPMLTWLLLQLSLQITGSVNSAQPTCALVALNLSNGLFGIDDSNVYGRDNEAVLEKMDFM